MKEPEIKKITLMEAIRESEDFENGFDEQERQMESENEIMEDSFLDNFD